MWKTKIFIFAALCCGLCGAPGESVLNFKPSDYFMTARLGSDGKMSPPMIIKDNADKIRCVNEAALIEKNKDLASKNPGKVFSRLDVAREALNKLTAPNTPVSALDGEYILINNGTPLTLLHIKISKAAKSITIINQSEKDPILALAFHYLITKFTANAAERTAILTSALTNETMKGSFNLLEIDRKAKTGPIICYLGAGLAKDNDFSKPASFV